MNYIKVVDKNWAEIRRIMNKGKIERDDREPDRQGGSVYPRYNQLQDACDIVRVKQNNKYLGRVEEDK